MGKKYWEALKLANTKNDRKLSRSNFLSPNNHLWQKTATFIDFFNLAKCKRIVNWQNDHVQAHFLAKTVFANACSEEDQSSGWLKNMTLDFKLCLTKNWMYTFASRIKFSVPREKEVKILSWTTKQSLITLFRCSWFGIEINILVLSNYLAFWQVWNSLKQVC